MPKAVLHLFVTTDFLQIPPIIFAMPLSDEKGVQPPFAPFETLCNTLCYSAKLSKSYNHRGTGISIM